MSDRKKWKTKCIELAKKIIRMKGKCEKCGRSDRQLQGAHVMSVKHEATCAETQNLMCLCAWDHTLAPDSWHESPLDQGWFEEKYPGRYEKLQKQARMVTKYIDWEEKYKSLKQELYESEKLRMV